MAKRYYVHGNAAREIETTQPARRQERSRRELEELKRNKIRRNAARRNRERALGMSKGYVLFLSSCVIVLALASAMLISTQSRVSDKMKEVSALQGQIQNVKADNDAKYKELTSSVDLKKIKKIAIKKLGMKYASKDQIIYYTVENNNFMDQYSDIPKK